LLFCDLGARVDILQERGLVSSQHKKTAIA
jgi:hypothetical protein